MTRVWVTRDEPPDGPLATALAAVGLDPVHEPVLETQVLTDAAQEIGALGAEDWLVLTSPRAIAAVAIGPARVPRVAVVGEASARAAHGLGMRVEFMSPTATGSGLWDALALLAAGRRVCFPRSSLATIPDLPGAELTAPVLYETRARPFDPDVAGRADIAALASPSAVHAVLDRLGSLPCPAAAIGPTTSAAVHKAGGTLLVESPRPGFDALAEAIADAVSSA